MCQRDVERVVGRLVTDEAFLARFAATPAETLRGLEKDGVVLSDCEIACLARTDAAVLSSIAKTIDPKLRKAALSRDGGPRDGGGAGGGVR